MRQRFSLRFLLLALGLLLGVLAVPIHAKPPKQRDIADSIAANPILTKFSAMVRASDMGTFLSSRGPFTVFAPTDSAFARLQPGVFEELLRPENKVRLQEIVLFHVVNGKRLTGKDLILLKTTLSCQGSPLNFKTSRLGTQYVMKAKIVSADLKCQNGVINEIDTMLMPPESSLPAIAAPPPAVPVPTNVPPANQDAVLPLPPLPPNTSIPPGATNTPPLAPAAETNAPAATPVVPAAATTNAP